MAKDPAFLFYPGDYLRDTQCLSEKSQVAYDRIMCEHMRNICISQEQLNFFTKKLNADEKYELLMVISKKDCGYQIEWVAESILKRKDYSDSRRKNRSSKSEKKTITYDSHMENENENEIINKVIIYLNKSASTNFKSNSCKTKKTIGARLKEGYSLEDFQKVINTKTGKWLNDPKMADYLRPETLFGPKFENYLNEKNETTSKNITTNQPVNEHGYVKP